MANRDEHGPIKGQRRQKLDKDIFGNEYLGTRAVLRIELDTSALTGSARELIELAEILDIDPASLLKEALDSVSDIFWADKLGELTPLEWKLLTALDDQEFRSDVAQLLGDVSTRKD